MGSLSKEADRSNLPVVVPMPETKFHETIPDHAKAFPKTETDPINEILLFYNEQKPEETGRVRRIIREQIDLPARKIMIEAMVLEISSQALDELGVQWDLIQVRQGKGTSLNKKLDGANDSLVLGQIAYPAASTAQLDATVTNVFREFDIRLQALVEKGIKKFRPDQVC